MDDALCIENGTPHEHEAHSVMSDAPSLRNTAPWVTSCASRTGLPTNMRQRASWVVR